MSRIIAICVFYLLSISGVAAQQDQAILDSVSVDPASGRTVLGWEASTDPTTAGYIIYEYVGNNTAIPLDTLLGSAATFYADTFLNPMGGSRVYVIAVIDMNNQAGNLTTAQRTIYLEPLSTDPCSGTIQLAWNQYVNMDPPVSGYHIYASDNGGSYTLIGTNSAGDTTFTHENLTPGHTYCYFIRAFQSVGSFTSSSNRRCTFLDGPSAPAFAYLRRATINPDGSVTLDLHVDNSVSISGFQVYRKEDGSTGYSVVGSMPYNGNKDYSFNDLDANTNTKSYTYSIGVLDSCGQESLLTNQTKTILLTGSLTGQDPIITWTEYQGFEGGIAAYQIYRSTDGSAFQLLTSYSTDPWSFTDDISYLTNGERVYYYVVAVESGPNVYGFSDESRSNVRMLFPESSLFVPNAFTPEGRNPVFKPTGSFISQIDYEFIVYSRWGVEIFSTDDPQAGWDGNRKKVQCEDGLYLYQVRYRDSQGMLSKKTGAVFLLRRSSYQE